jgi:hypothetical protein
MRLDDVLGVFMAISQQTIFDAPISLTVNRQVGESTCKASLPLFGPYKGVHFTPPYIGGPSKRTRLTLSYLCIIKRKFLMSTRAAGVVAPNIFSGHLKRPAAYGGPEALTKWTVMVVGALSEGPIRYNEIRRRVEGNSQRMLTLTPERAGAGWVGHLLTANDVSPGLRGSVARAAGYAPLGHQKAVGCRQCSRLGLDHTRLKNWVRVSCPGSPAKMNLWIPPLTWRSHSQLATTRRFALPMWPHRVFP